MVWPVSDVNTGNADVGTDNPATFRADVLDLIQKFNQLRNHVSTNMQGVLAASGLVESSGNYGVGTPSPSRRFVASNSGAQGFEFGPGVGPSSSNELLNYNRSTTQYVPLHNYASAHFLYSGTGGSILGIHQDTTGAVGVGLSPTARNNTRLQIVDGIGFPATQVPSTDPNTLDDYEEGMFTPSLGGTATYNARSGSYTKMGRLVTVRGSIWVLLIGTGSTTVISGFPFTSNSTAIYQGSCRFFSSATAVASCVASTNAGTAAAALNSTTGAVTSMTSPAIFANGTTVDFTITYETD